HLQFVDTIISQYLKHPDANWIVSIPTTKRLTCGSWQDQLFFIERAIGERVAGNAIECSQWVVGIRQDSPLVREVAGHSHVLTDGAVSRGHVVGSGSGAGVVANTVISHQSTDG